MKKIKTIDQGLAKIDEVLGKGGYLASDFQPCAAVANYDKGEELPWRISDDWASESYATLAEAVRGAKDWVKRIAAE